MSYRLNCQNLTKILSRNRSQSPSRIPVVPAAELHRRNSQKRKSISHCNLWRLSLHKRRFIQFYVSIMSHNL